MDAGTRRAEQEAILERLRSATGDAGFAAIRERDGDTFLHDALRRGLLCSPFLRACVGSDLASEGHGEGRYFWEYIRHHARFLQKEAIFPAFALQEAIDHAPGMADLTWDELVAATPGEPDAIDLLKDGIFPPHILQTRWREEVGKAGISLRQLDREVHGRWRPLLAAHVAQP